MTEKYEEQEDVNEEEEDAYEDNDEEEEKPGEEKGCRCLQNSPVQSGQFRSPA